ncbi:MAG: LysM peptidoglycan-binding domain-containing protein [Verrucomicrobiota bacterium]|nr:LysM peptidoglycan-binding domain-containing protein [Verrucomicrobiota bacterium]
MMLRAVLVLPFLALSGALAQTPEASPGQMETLSKKIDEINVKLDALSQEMLKLEQHVMRPGTMIGEATPVPTVSPAVSIAPAGSTHTVARGETLTSIAKAYKVGVDELQKFNHIEDGRKLQAGQTILIPGTAATPAPSPAASPTP